MAMAVAGVACTRAAARGAALRLVAAADISRHTPWPAASVLAATVTMRATHGLHTSTSHAARAWKSPCVRNLPLLDNECVVFPGEQAGFSLSDPAHQLMCQDIMGRPPRLRHIGVVKHKEAKDLDHSLFGETDYLAEEVGTLVQVESLQSFAEPDKPQLLATRAVGRFRVVKKRRLPWGYWSCTAAVVHDEPWTPETASALTTVKNLLWEYAQFSLLLNETKLQAFKRRLDKKAADDATSFSLWVAMQLKTRLAQSEEGRQQCQHLLEARSADKRLELCQGILVERLEHLQTQEQQPAPSDGGSTPTPHSN